MCIFLYFFNLNSTILRLVGLKETMFSRYKRQAVMQNDPTKDENELLPEFPHIVSIVPEKGRMLCLGVLISESLVLAPGNCLAFK